MAARRGRATSPPADALAGPKLSSARRLVWGGPMSPRSKAHAMWFASACWHLLDSHVMVGWESRQVDEPVGSVANRAGRFRQQVSVDAAQRIVCAATRRPMILCFRPLVNAGGYVL
jgi:hypothetical protein